MSDAMKNTRRAVLIVSGGMDSCVLSYYYAAAGFNLHLLSFDYGQRHLKELDYAKRYIEHLRQRYSSGPQALEILHETIELPIARLSPNSTSALLNADVEMPHGHYSDDNMKITVVPYRNPNMLLQAATVAWNEGASVIAYAAHAGDHSQYPDCRPAFVEAFNTMLARSMDDNTVTVEVPFMRFTKAQIARLGASLGVPFEQTWSCYEGGEQHCGLCGTCVERREAFLLAGVPDPTVYEREPDPSVYER
ncbi:7-cyano-7-deazaguanine synthase [Thermosporothrix hazakensis]|uniref:7-cyano-7-deazaguanine synthase n=2 Tax=Thermosporothrix TaxID=768650 RepID=A0A326U693_THEHA|nr:7-cyano-7-deazaguanine synthase QueC [Thermosporothrix hazakensis]PZW27488.1 7-cyano-7-deazaguanine synthase [Thermosporothrix hazakensis]BBH85919.1 7-cyano-7-deazaguanine synthase [Thermosporothrix sp. COM3]GCE45654.1 7-cyano-7-deazaguanine synthase [Thermosporothrix hazakensis]